MSPHPMPRRTAALSGALPARRRFFLPVSAPTGTVRPREQESAARQNGMCVNSTHSSFVARLVSGYRQRVDEKYVHYVHYAHTW